MRSIHYGPIPHNCQRPFVISVSDSRQKCIFGSEYTPQNPLPVLPGRHMFFHELWVTYTIMSQITDST